MKLGFTVITFLELLHILKMINNFFIQVGMYVKTRIFRNLHQQHFEKSAR